MKDKSKNKRKGSSKNNVKDETINKGKGLPKNNVKDEIINKVVSYLKDLVLTEIEKQMKNPEVQKKIVDILPIPRGVKDFIKENTGLVNKHSLEVAIELALKTCTCEDKEKQQVIMAFISALYHDNQIKRAAQVGGSLLKRFGNDYFPEIKEKELRYALDVSKQSEEFYLEKIKNKWNSF